MAFEVSAVGTISNGRVFFDATAWTKTKLGLPDGLKVDKEGSLRDRPRRLTRVRARWRASWQHRVRRAAPYQLRVGR
jgi:hypothetical protein